MVALGDLLALLAVLSAVLFIFVKHKHNHWAKKGIKHDKLNLVFGNLTNVFTFKQSIYELFDEMYFKYPDEKVVGFYSLARPMLLIRDLDIIKDICIKNFDSFVNRSFRADKRGDPLAYELIFGKLDDAWRRVRHKFASAFSSGKMKKMYPLVNRVGENINKLCTDTAQTGKREVNMNNYCTRYSVDVISSCAFGSEGRAISAPEQSVMFKILNNIFNFKAKAGIASNLLFLQQWGIYAFLSRLGLGIKVFHKEIEDDVYKVVDIAAKQRLQSDERRGDIFDEIVFSDSPDFQGLAKKAGLSFQMLIGGSETSATTLVFALYELAKHPELQRKLQKEIRENLEKHNGEVPYEVLNNMEYLDQVFKETVRLYPILPFLDRVASRDYQIAGTDITIEKGTAVYIPMWAIHRDPNYFPDPEAFKPERFSKENGQSIPEMAYIPFGAGPRYCIGKRFGIMSVKSFLVNFFKDFDVHLSEQSKRPLEWNKKTFTLSVENGLTLVISPTKHVD